MRWAPYVPVVKRRAQAASKMEKLKIDITGGGS